ncbi:unnamed protein product [Schistocephalus solidus]|uniref:Uncharacterized protein n=1 Tax=Schistocephalus solidus TaxID=70667 RepID=A0A183SAY8_SCHSO|nr:unnamed protein product [Schistocephalus solidus]
MEKELCNVAKDAVAAYRIVILRSMSASSQPDPAVAHSVALPTGYPTDMTEFPHSKRDIASSIIAISVQS